MLRFVSVAAIAAFCASAASAQWFHEESGGAFTDTPLQIAGVSVGRYTFGARCTRADDLVLLYITPEQMTSSAARQLTALGPVLLVRVDDDAVLELDAQIDVSGTQAGFVAIPDPELITALAAARGRIAVAARLAGELFHEQEFGVARSGQTLGLLRENCLID